MLLNYMFCKVSFILHSSTPFKNTEAIFNDLPVRGATAVTSDDGVMSVMHNIDTGLKYSTTPPSNGILNRTPS